jgi:hypothetical protein
MLNGSTSRDGQDDPEEANEDEEMGWKNCFQPEDGQACWLCMDLPPSNQADLQRKEEQPVDETSIATSTKAK